MICRGHSSTHSSQWHLSKAPPSFGISQGIAYEFCLFLHAIPIVKAFWYGFGAGLCRALGHSHEVERMKWCDTHNEGEKLGEAIVGSWHAGPVCVGADFP